MSRQSEISLESFFYMMNSLAIIHRDLTGNLKEISGLPVTGYRILLFISDSKQRVRITDIASALDMKFTSVAATVEKLVQSSFISRTADPQDKRASELALSSDGEAILREIDKSLLGKLNTRWVALTKKQRDVLLIDFGKSHVTSGYVASIEVPYATVKSSLKQQKITCTQYLILFFLYLHGTQRPKDIARMLVQKPTTVSLAMINLEEQNLISKERSTEHRSATNTNITREGSELTLEATKIARFALGELELPGYNEKDEQELAAISRIVVDAATGTETLRRL